MGGSDISSRNIRFVLIPRLLIAMVLAPHAVYGEAIDSTGYAVPEVFHYDYSGLRPIEAFQTERIENRVPPSYKPEFRNTEYYAIPPGQDLQQYLLSKGFKFRDIPEASGPADDSSRFRRQPTRGRAGYQWSSDDGSMRPAPIFRPLNKVGLKTSEHALGRDVAPAPVPATAPYGLSSFGAELPYTSVGPVFRPIP